EMTPIPAPGLRPVPHRCKDHANKHAKACGICCIGFGGQKEISREYSPKCRLARSNPISNAGLRWVNSKGARPNSRCPTLQRSQGATALRAVLVGLRRLNVPPL